MSPSSVRVLAVAGLVLCACPARVPSAPEAGSAPVAELALYAPGAPDDGVWKEEVTALESLFKAGGWTWKRIGPAEINAGALVAGGSPSFKALVVPGGYAVQRNLAINEAGEASIHDFIKRGGGFVGFCAGAYWPAASVVWAEKASGGGGHHNQASDYVAYPYQLGLYPGAAQGPFGWTPWTGGMNASLEVVAINRDNPTMAALGLPAVTRFFYYGGPFFPSMPKDGYEVWATAVMPKDTPVEASAGDGQPTIVRFSEGKGTVVLFSYHPDVLIGSMADGVELSTFIHEKSVAWDTGNQTQDEINLQSWNVVRGAVQLASGRKVTPLTALP